MAATRCSLLFALLLVGCDQEQPAGRAEDLPHAACEEQAFEKSRFTVCRYDPASHRLEMFAEARDGTPLRSFEKLEAHLGKRASDLLFAMNAGMFDEDGRPIGLYVEAGNRTRPINLRRGGGNFHLMPNGVFAINRQGKTLVMPSEGFAASNPAVEWATQSGPMLVIEGKLHPAFDQNGESLHVRNGVGACRGGVAWFAISDEPVSFGRFARLFKDKLHCRNALFLDGAVSSLWEAGVRQDQRAPLGPMVAVFRR